MSNPLLILGSPLLPNVPDLPGVPPIARTLGVEAVSAIGMLDPSLEKAIFGGPTVTHWGISDMQGNQAIKPDSFVKMEEDASFEIASYPVEQGSFASYNKVKAPFSGTVTLAKGGSSFDRGSFLTTAQNLLKSLHQYQIFTPEKTYFPLTFDRMDYERRIGAGAYILIVHLHFKEIRIAPPIQYGPSGQKQPTSQVPASAKGNQKTATGLPNPTKTASPTSQAMANSGSVGASSLSGAVSSALNAAEGVVSSAVSSVEGAISSVEGAIGSAVNSAGALLGISSLSGTVSSAFNAAEGLLGVSSLSGAVSSALAVGSVVHTVVSLSAW